MIDKKQLRRSMRQSRRALSPREQHRHSLCVSRHLSRMNCFRSSRRIACYFSADGELDITVVAKRAQSTGKNCFYPVLHNGRRIGLWFSEYRAGDPLLRNRYGIYEPLIRRRPPVKPWALDLVLVPLVAFDAHCNRLGMGGGYYDRSFSYLNSRKLWRKPRLVGIAHECQRVASLQTEPWDIPLDAVVTECRVYHR